MVGAEYDAQTTLSGVQVMAMARVQPIAMNSAIFLNLFATNVAKTTQIQSCWY